MCLVICSKTLNYFSISTYDLNPKPNSVLPILPIRSHRVSLVISHCQTLIILVSPMGSRSHRDGLGNSLLPLQYSRSHRDMQSVPPSLLGQISVSLITQIDPTEFEKSVKPSFGFTLTLAHRSQRVDPVSPTENL